MALTFVLGVSSAQSVTTDPTEISVAMTINSNYVTEPVKLFTSDDAIFYYSPQIHQIYFVDASNTHCIMYQYTYHGNIGDRTLSYTVSEPNAVLGICHGYGYISKTGKLDKQLDVIGSNSKFIGEDITLMQHGTHILGCNVNNQGISPVLNRILMTCKITYGVFDASNR